MRNTSSTDAADVTSALFVSNAKLEKLHTGMEWCEGPVYFPASDTLLFSDIPNHQLLKWSPLSGTSILETQSNYTNGNTRDLAGRRVSCEHQTNSVIRVEADGTRTVLAETFNGKRLNSPNDVVVASDGSIWFTDPTYGILSDREGTPRPSEQDSCNVYRIDPETGVCENVCDSLIMPNGLAFSLDERTLYVADSSKSHFDYGNNHIFAFTVTCDNTLVDKRIFHEISHGVPDGMRVDELGNLWCSSARGVEILASNGEHIGLINVPETVANLTFGGPDGKQLFIAATTSLYAIRVGVKGADPLLAERHSHGKSIQGRTIG